MFAFLLVIGEDSFEKAAIHNVAKALKALALIHRR